SICPHGNVLKLYQNGISRLSHFDWYFICPRLPKSKYSLGASPIGLPTGTAIFLNESRLELIAIVQGSTNLNLSANYFVNV
ncbi:hypothetical protein, partial [Microcoleus sp. PH2017_22_RUC_O_B]